MVPLKVSATFMAVRLKKKIIALKQKREWRMKQKTYNRNDAFAHKVAFRAAQAEVVRKIERKTVENVVFQAELLMLLALHDKFGFGRDRCLKAIEAFRSNIASYNLVDLTGCDMDSVAQVLRDELKIEIDDEQLDIATLRKGMVI